MAGTHECERIAAIAGLLHDAAIGAAPSHAWPHDDVVHGYWVEPGRVLAGEYPGHPKSEETASRKIDHLVDHGIRTFVDITGLDDQMAPYDGILGHIHCWGGMGRTATVIGCMLVDSGLDGETALARIRELRAPTRKGHWRAPQTDEQDDVVLQRSERR